MRVTSRSLRSYRSAVDEQAELARSYTKRALDAYFDAHPNATTGDAREFCVELLKASMPNFCDAAGTLAADFFDEVCEAEGIEVTSELYEATDYTIVEDKVRYFAERLNEGDAEAFKREVVDATHYFVKRSAYDNMVMNCEANDVRYARVPSGFETCPFCFMLASRGFVYRSEESARGVHGYHDNCDCCIVPGKKGRTVIEGYDPKGMDERWLACEKSIGGDAQAKKDWEALPKKERDAYIQRHKSAELAFRKFKTNRIMREVETRDWHWLYAGEAPDITYESQELKELKERKYPHEIETAKALRPFGVRCDFVVDEEYEEDGNGKRTGNTISYADCGSGYELKTTKGASSYNTINGHLKNASKKKNAKYVVFDNRNNKNMSDEQLIEWLNESRTFRRGRVYIIDQQGDYRYIR